MNIIDFHTHAFPDNLAEKAINSLSYKSHVKPSYDGTINGLLNSMDKSGIEKSVVLNIATKPTQTENIINWCKKIKSERITPFASIHPENLNYKELIKRIKYEGIKGIKLHPMYQNFHIDEDKMFFIYEEIAKQKLLLLFHSGFDIAYPDDERADFIGLLKVNKKLPELKIIASHTGAWKMWNKVLKYAKEIDFYIETSMTLKYIDDKNIFYKILNSLNPEKILFGTDSPWGDQKEEVNSIKNLNISKKLKEKILYQNAINLIKNG